MFFGRKLCVLYFFQRFFSRRQFFEIFHENFLPLRQRFVRRAGSFDLRLIAEHYFFRFGERGYKSAHLIGKILIFAVLYLEITETYDLFVHADHHAALSFRRRRAAEMFGIIQSCVFVDFAALSRYGNGHFRADDLHIEMIGFALRRLLVRTAGNA